MISGYYIDNIVNIRKKIFKITTLLVLTSFIYYLYDQTFQVNVTESLIQNSIFKSVIGKSYWHLWYLYKYVIFLLLVPIYKVIFNSLKFDNVIYIFVLIVFYQTIYSYVNKYIVAINSNLFVEICVDPVFVFPFLGFVVRKFYSVICGNVVWYIFAILIGGFVIDLILFNFHKNEIMQGDEFFIKNLSIFLSLFIFIICKKYSKYLCSKWINKFASKVLYVYLIHIFILWKINVFNNIYDKIINVDFYQTGSFIKPILSILIVILCFLLSMFVAVFVVFVVNVFKKCLENICRKFQF